MRSHSPAEQRQRIAAFLAHQRTGVLCCASGTNAIAGQGMWALPVWYRPESGSSDGRSLEVDCLLPRWADIAHYLTQAARVILIVQASSGAGLRWAQMRGMARPVEAPDWAGLLPRWVSIVEPDTVYLVVRLTPNRIDLIDEDLGWGMHETLEW
jgi:hypothetical protein